MKRNIVLLGGSNSVRVNGLQKGIKDEVERKTDLTFYNLALGSCTSFQNLYELKRKRNKEIFDNAELVITESNINEANNNKNPYEKLPLTVVYRNLNWFYKELYFLNKKVVSLLLPNEIGNYKIINNMHRELCKKYGFNCIDMQYYYEIHNLSDFGKEIDWAHQLNTIMYVLGRDIIKALDDFLFPKSLNIKNDNPAFKECIISDMDIIDGELKEINMKNSMYKETTYRLFPKTILKFPNNFYGYHIVGLHAWNNTADWVEDFNPPKDFEESLLFYSSLKIGGGGECIVKEISMLNLSVEIQNKFVISDNTLCSLGANEKCHKEYFSGTYSWVENSQQLSFCDLVAFFLAEDKGNFHNGEYDFNIFNKEYIDIPNEYDFNAIIPPVEIYKEVVYEYCKQLNIMTKGEINERKFVDLYNHKFIYFLYKIAHKLKQRANLQYIKYKFIKIFNKMLAHCNL